MLCLNDCCVASCMTACVSIVPFVDVNTFLDVSNSPGKYSFSINERN